MNNKKLIRITTVPQSFKGLLNGQLKFMSENGINVCAVSSPGKSLNELKDNEKVNIYAIEMTRSITPWKDLLSLLKLYKFFRLEKPDIVHSHTPKAGTLGMLAAKLANVPIRIHTVVTCKLPLKKDC